MLAILDSHLVDKVFEKTSRMFALLTLNLGHKLFKMGKEALQVSFAFDERTTDLGNLNVETLGDVLELPV